MAELNLAAEITSESELGLASVTIDVERGGRLASLIVDGHQLLVQPGTLGPMQWGSYPMVPWAGRVRQGTFSHDGRSYELPRNLPPHSAHGVGFTSPWTIVDNNTISLELGAPWPFGGRATQRFEIDQHGLLMTLSVTATAAMPVMLGWHPWFNRYLAPTESSPQPRSTAAVEAELRFGPGPMYELDDSAIPTGRLIDAPDGPWDNCFTALEHQPSIEWPGILRLNLTSSCSHWVIYTEPEDALCVEPQSDAPDVFNRPDRPVLAAGEERVEWFRLDWAAGDPR